MLKRCFGRLSIAFKRGIVLLPHAELKSADSAVDGYSSISQCHWRHAATLNNSLTTCSSCSVFSMFGYGGRRE